MEIFRGKNVSHGRNIIGLLSASLHKRQGKNNNIPGPAQFHCVGQVTNY